MISDGRVPPADKAPSSPDGAAVHTSQRPRLLSDLWQFWKAYAHRASGYQSVILLTLVYYLVLGPSAIIAQLTGQRLLRTSSQKASTYWLDRPAAEKTLAALERQF